MTGGVAIFLILTAAIETAAVVCACLPVIGPQIVKLYRRRAAHSRSDYPYYGDSGTPSSKRSARLRNWRSRGGGGGGGGGPPGQGGFTQFGSLNHITDLDETIATHHDDGGSGRYGDEVELTSVPADHQNLGGRDDSWERALHAFVPDSSLPQKQGQILVRTDVEVEVSPALFLFPFKPLFLINSRLILPKSERLTGIFVFRSMALDQSPRPSHTSGRQTKPLRWEVYKY